MYALNIAEDGRILSVTYPQYAVAGMPIVDTLPEGDYNDYKYIEHEPVMLIDEPAEQQVENAESAEGAEMLPQPQPLPEQKTWEYIYDPLPKPAPEPKQPTELEQLRADVDYIAVMGGIEL